ncbi:MAG: SprT family zinc-dependent metalloprotease [Planctomycetes bacterium]|nr:SprT family zinc-dependent metalloprotease [Planctomycetota bacterium]
MRSIRFDDLWKPAPGGPLPGKPVLHAIADRCGRAWDIPDLRRRARMGYSTRLRTTLGRAFLEDGLIELNARLLTDHPGELVATLIHELAHLVVFWRYGRVRPHGTQFRTLMRAVNLPADATHDLDVDQYRLRRRRYLYLHCCTHCRTYFISRRVYRNYYCTRCGPHSSFEVVRAPDTPTGRRMLRAAKP